MPPVNRNTDLKLSRHKKLGSNIRPPFLARKSQILNQLEAAIDAENNNDSSFLFGSYRVQENKVTSQNDKLVNGDAKGTYKAPCHVKLVDLFQNDSPYLKYFEKVKVNKVTSQNDNPVNRDAKVTYKFPCHVKLVDLFQNDSPYLKYFEEVKENKVTSQNDKLINRDAKTQVVVVDDEPREQKVTYKVPCHVKLVDLFQNDSPYLKYFKKITTQKNKGYNKQSGNKIKKRNVNTQPGENKIKEQNENTQPSKNKIKEQNENTHPDENKIKEQNENTQPSKNKMKEQNENTQPGEKKIKAQKNENAQQDENKNTVTNNFILCSVKLVDFKLQDPAAYLKYLAEVLKKKWRRPAKHGSKPKGDKKTNKKNRPKKDIIIVKMPFKRRGELIFKNKYAHKKRKLNKKPKRDKKKIKKMPELKVTSEIYKEFDYKTNTTPTLEGNVVSEFPFLLSKSLNQEQFDGDNDLERPQKEYIKIEHSPRTNIALVGLQVWRGAFLLGDLTIFLGLKGELHTKTILELGAGTGITSFVASMYAKNVVCTDINTGGILDLIKLNAQYNSHLKKSQFQVLPLDFTEPTWSQDLTEAVNSADIILAADVIYDDDVTAAFVSTMQKILNTRPPKTIYIALEKRYVFTIEHMDSVAPCYETFLTLLDKVKTENVHSKWTIEQIPLDFPKYFTYDRVKELVLWRITSTPC